jgi:hypothetical protein
MRAEKALLKFSQPVNGDPKGPATAGVNPALPLLTSRLQQGELP